MALFNNTSFRLLEQGLDAVWLKQKVISQNIANADTPGYKAKTVNFSTVLKEKCKSPYHRNQSGQDGVILKTTIAEEKSTNQLADGNNVDMEKETVALADAQLQYDVLSGKISNEFSMLRTAISR